MQNKLTNFIIAKSNKKYQNLFKIVIDFILAFIALSILIPFLIPVVIELLLTGEHHVLYLQKRIGSKNKISVVR
jgi:lipopolysaccharide/colanic/teichoic acid biosynthesis glycosyltransferase